MKSIKEAGNLEAKKVLVRVDWNVPVEDGKVLDTSRIEMSLPTIKYLLEEGASVVVMSHFGRSGESLRPVYEIFNASFPAIFVEDPFSEAGKEKIKNKEPEEVVVLENLRKEPDEELNNEKFAQDLASLADIYVNEAFSASHRSHASIVGVPKYLPGYAGFRFLEEVEKLSEAFNPEHPFLFILGGAKFETKLPLVEKFLTIADDVFIGGANAYPASLLPVAKNPKIIFPVGDIRALDAFSETLEVLKPKIDSAKFILWNGPLGKYEAGYKEGTLKLISMLGQSGAKVIAGGGDTENLTDESSVISKFYFISLSGGAMLDFLATGTLPGIEALNK
jgi:phosphoglycerate kinase